MDNRNWDNNRNRDRNCNFEIPYNVERIWRRRDEPRIPILPIEKFDGDATDLADWLLTYETDARACDCILKALLGQLINSWFPQKRDTWPNLIRNFRRKISLTDDIAPEYRSQWRRLSSLHSHYVL